MAPRTTHGARRYKYSDFVPTANAGHADLILLMARDILAKFGVTDIPTYFQRLRFLILACVVWFAHYGSTIDGTAGAFFGALFGIVAPVVLLGLGLILAFTLAMLAVWFAAWAVLLLFLSWFIPQMFRF